MSKKFTSFVVLLAALLLTLPTQAQTAVKRQAKFSQVTAMKSGKAMLDQMKRASAARQKAELAKEEGLAFRGYADGSSLLIASLEKAQDDKIALAKLMDRNLQAAKMGAMKQLHSGDVLASMQFSSSRTVDFRAVKTDASASRRAATVDANGIITAPDEGEHKFYQRAGSAYYLSNNSVYSGAQSGTVEIVECADGTVYIKNIVSEFAYDVWVKGTKNGNTITVAAGQPQYYVANYQTTLSVNWGTINDAGNSYERAEGDITFTIDGDVISLDGSSQSKILGIFWDDDNSWQGFGDYETVWTYNPDYVAPQLVELPEGAEVQTWYKYGNTNSNSGAVNFEGNASVAFVGDEVYISGFSDDFPESWIKGTIDGDKVVFPSLQFVGKYSTYDIYATGTDRETLTDYVMTYDAAKQTLTGTDLLLNAATDRIYYLAWIENLTLSKDEPVFEEPVATTGDAVDVLPYSNALATEEDFGVFGVIDSNRDNNTWKFDSNGANYSYSATNTGDDWLISPAVLLEAGKLYHFALDVKSASTRYAEKFEVKLGAEPKASAMTETVIGETSVASTEYATYENEAIAVSETGYYHIGIHAISDPDMFRLTVANFLIEVGAAPTAPEAVSALSVAQVESDLNVAVKFTAPAKAISGDELTENIARIDVLRNNEVVKSFENVAPGSEQEFIDAVPSVGRYNYQVIPYDAEGAGRKSDVVSVLVTTILDVPTTFDMTADASVLELFKTIDNNADNNTWRWSQSGAFYGYSSTLAADDYLVTMPFRLQAGKKYNVTAVANASNDTYPERMEVVVGKEATVEALTTTVIPATDILTTTPTEYEGEFTVEEDGEYYVAVHAISDADMANLYITKLTVEAGAEPKAPAAVEDLAVVPGAEGALEATVSFTAPTKAVDGSALIGSVNVDVYRNDVLVNTVKSTVGQTQTWTDNSFEEAGNYTYYVRARNGKGLGQKSEKQTVFVGVDVIGAPTDFAYVSDTENSISFKWNASEGQNGGYVNTANIDYSVWTLTEEVVWFWTELVADQQIGAVTGETALTAAYNTDEGEQEFKYFGVSAKQGETETDPGVAYNAAWVGAPYKLPVVDPFLTSGFNYSWYYFASSENVSANYGEVSSDNDGGSFAFQSAGAEEWAYFTNGKISLAGAENPTLLFDAYCEGLAGVAAVAVKADGTETPLELTATDTKNGFKTYKANLTPFAAERYVKIHFYTIFAGAGTATFDNIKVVDLYQQDMSVAVTAPASVKAGETALINVTVKNEGEQATSGSYTVSVTAGNEALYQETFDESLASFESQELTVEFPTTIFADAADVDIVAKVDYELDLNEDNNVAEAMTTIKESSAAQPKGVTAEQGAEGVDLTWTAPENATAEVTETFSAYENGANETGEVGAWTLVNANGQPKGGIFQDTQLASDGQPLAWEVFNLATLGGDNTSFAGADGLVDNNYLISVYNATTEGYPGNDDWLISPELPGVAQTISFNVKAFNDYGAQTYQVLYSTTGKETADFQLIQEVADNGGAWSNVTFQLPAGAKYFAIRNVTDGDNGFVLAVDDITYLVGGGEVLAYNIYVDGQLYATVEGDVTKYTVPNSTLTEGEHTFAVSAVSTSGESKPVEVTMSVVTGIQQIAAEGQAVDVYSLDGKLVRKQTKSLNGLKGVYVINGKAVIVK